MYRVRSRLINFRVTEEEFQHLKTASALQGARCLSDFARNTILGSARGQYPPNHSNDSIDAVLVGFDRRLSALEVGLERLAGALSQREPAASKGGD